MTAIALQHRDEIIARVAQGEYLASIARDLGLKGKGQSISDYLANDPEYQGAREFGLEAKLAAREAELEAVRMKADVPRARELLSHARWRAERECPARWGQRSIVAVEHTSPDAAQILGAAADLVRALERRRARVIPSGIVADAQLIDPA